MFVYMFSTNEAVLDRDHFRGQKYFNATFSDIFYFIL